MTNPHQPWANIRSASNTSPPGDGKIRRPRRAQSPRRRQATPHRLAAAHGIKTPVTVTLRIRYSAEMWLEVVTDQGRFFCAFDVSAFDLVRQIIEGGHQVEELSPALLREHKTGQGWLNGS